MHLPTALLTLTAATLGRTAPTNQSTNTAQTSNTNSNPTDFLLLTTTSSTKPSENTNSTDLPSVSATSLFSPFSSNPYFLRLIGPGYNSLPRFNLTSNGVLETEASGPHGVGEFEYNSTRVRAGEELQFQPEEERKGNLGLEDGVFLTVGGEKEGWKVCEGDLGQSVVAWKSDDESCTDVFIQAAQDAPY